MDRSEYKIVVCGGGLAGLLTSAALAGALRAPYKIVFIDDRSDIESDILFGSVTAPTAYDFLLSLGLDEPTLFSRTNTSFSFGTHYVNWPSAPGDCMQAHHQPFPLFSGLPLQHHLTRLQQSLGPILISGEAARQGRFAHPPEDRGNPLSRAEYGYQFDPETWSNLMQSDLGQRQIERVSGKVETASSENGVIKSVTLADGRSVVGDLFVDCTGQSRAVLQVAGGVFEGRRSISVQRTTQATPQLGPPCRRVEGSNAGWGAQTFLQDCVQSLQVSNADGAGIRAELGRVDQAWVANCVAIGRSASVQDPLTPGPMIMLQRDIERLLSLIPVDAVANVERREFNRRFANDHVNTSMFAGAFYMSEPSPENTFWKTAQAAESKPELERKLAQFESRGLLVKYDLEPFNDEDWTMLNFGLGRHPRRHDLQAEAVSKAEIEQQISNLRQAVAQIVSRMPPHHLYVANMKRYFEKQQYA